MKGALTSNLGETSVLVLKLSLHVGLVGLMDLISETVRLTNEAVRKITVETRQGLLKLFNSK